MREPTIVITGGVCPAAELRELTGLQRPKVAMLPTAVGDGIDYIAGLYDRFPPSHFEPQVVSLFRRTIPDVRSVLLEADIIWVSGGNTANMLAVWRVHGVDRMLRECWESGVILAGGSAGALCWFEDGPTDSFDKFALHPLGDGLGFLPGSHCAHYSHEVARRPFYRNLVAGGFPAGLAVDDECLVRFEATTVAEIRSLAPGAGAYAVFAADGQAVEQPAHVGLRLPVGAPAES